MAQQEVARPPTAPTVEGVKLPAPLAAVAPWALAAFAMTQATSATTVAACVAVRYLAVFVCQLLPDPPQRAALALALSAALIGVALMVMHPEPLLISSLAGLIGALSANALARAEEMVRHAAVLTALCRALGALIGVLVFQAQPLAVVVLLATAAYLPLFADLPPAHPRTRRTGSVLLFCNTALASSLPVVVFAMAASAQKAALTLVALQLGTAALLWVAACVGHRSFVVGNRVTAIGLTQRSVLLATTLTGCVWVLVLLTDWRLAFLAGIPLGFAAELTKTSAASHPFKTKGLDASRTLLIGLITAGPLGLSIAHGITSNWAWLAVAITLASATLSHHRLHCRRVLT